MKHFDNNQARAQSEAILKSMKMETIKISEKSLCLFHSEHEKLPFITDIDTV